MGIEESVERGPAAEQLAKLIHDRFDERSIETGWAGTAATLTPWDRDDPSVPPRYKEALRLTAEDVLMSDWFYEMVRHAACETLDAAIERWKEGQGVPPGKISLGSGVSAPGGTLTADAYVPQGSVTVFLKRFMDELEKEERVE